MHGKRQVMLAAFILGSTACGPKPVSPEERYTRAVNQRLNGEAAAYYDTLIELAHEAPESRAGRKARATISGSNMAVYFGAAGLLAAVAVPNFIKYQTRARQSEAKQTLSSIAVAMAAARDEDGQFCRDLSTCGIEIPEDARYLYFLSPQAVYGGGGAEDPGVLRLRANDALHQLNLQPHVSQHELLIVAIGNIDGDATLDVWTVDANSSIKNLLNDVDE